LRFGYRAQKSRQDGGATRASPHAVILLALTQEGSGVARAFASPAICAGAHDQSSKDLSSIAKVAATYIQDRFFDSMSRRSAENQKRGPFRSE
jgi:hypothetical protein